MSGAVVVRPAAVLFDLDGTLVDSAPDLAGAANDMRRERGLQELPYASLRQMVGSGARGMVGRAFDRRPEHDDYLLLRDEFLARYADRLTRETHLFAGVAPLLAALDGQGLVWGIVTNKASRFSEPLTRALGLATRAGVLVSGDSTPHSKPHPAPLLEAARRLGVAPEACWYAGDDLRDMQAGHAAGMTTVAAAWGYLGDGLPVEAWGAEHVVDHPEALLHLLGLA